MGISQTGVGVQARKVLYTSLTSKGSWYSLFERTERLFHHRTSEVLVAC